jgi:RNA polymerase sigma-70 factor (ECF subfamily)
MALVRPGWRIEGMTQSRTEQPAKDLARHLPKITRLTREAQSKSAGEEWEIVQRALAGESGALATLFARHRVKLYRAAFSLLRNKEDAEDALQDGLLSAYVNLRAFEGRSQFSTWLTRIVLNAALMNRRKLHAHPLISLDEPVFDEGQRWTERAEDGRPDPEQVYALAETMAVVKREMSQLSPVLQSAIQTLDRESFHDIEPARMVPVNRSTFKSRMSRARWSLARQLTTRGVNLRNCYF